MRLPLGTLPAIDDPDEEDERLHEAARRCPHTRNRWAVVAVLLAIWAVASFTLQRIDVHPLDAVLERYRHSRTGEVISVRPGDDVAAIYDIQPLQPGEKRLRAAFVVLAQNGDTADVVLSMTRLLRRFNNTKTRYPWVFLNDGDFSEEFRNATTAAAAGPTRYGKIGKEHWGYPPWVPERKAAQARKQQVHDGVLYGGRESYHHMCRWYSGFFQHHPLLADIDYFWRVEPDVHFYCDLAYDPFRYMHQHGVKYGFTLAVLEGPKTIPTLWDVTQDFMDARPELVPEANLLDFVTSEDGSYGLCHFWSNFELGDLRWFRSPQYQAYFQHLDRTGGFFYERWGDAPVHSLAASMFLNASEVHHFSDIGYRHNSFNNCPAVKRNNCDCDAARSLDQHALPNSFGRCHGLWDRLMKEKLEAHHHV